MGYQPVGLTLQGKTIAADNSENSSNEVEDSNPRPVVTVPLDDIVTGKFSCIGIIYAHLLDISQLRFGITGYK